MFRNANNVVVTGGNFTNINNGGNHDAVSTTLWQQIAPGAIFDSAERYASGKCHPGTRQRMIERMSDWINDPDPAQSILWLYGPAGSGKSALAHSICELLMCLHPERYGGSFFFARGPTNRGKGTKLFPTLAYQLAVQFPSMRSEINDALYRDPSLLTKSIDIQLLFLIIQPLLQCGSWPSHTPTIVIDGLDECDEDDGIDTQHNIISLISRSIVEHNVPLRFMIASRPEYWIRDAFETLPFPNITVTLSLRDDVDADKDIKAYLTENFNIIRLDNKRIMESVETPWPPSHIVNRFVEEASGQYIYASTVLKFVGKSTRFTNPQEQLRIITTPGPHRASAFSELDRLYATILSAYPRRETMKRVLGGLLADAHVTTIEVVLGVDPAEVILVLDALSSLIDIARPSALSENELLLEPIFGPLLVGEEKISFCHLTFREFLEDETRSGPFYVDVSNVHGEIARAFFSKIHKNLDENYETEPHLSFNIELTTYRHLMSGIIFHSVPYCETDMLLLFITNMNERLQIFAPGVQMNYPACLMQDMEWIETMLSETEGSHRSVMQQVEETTSDVADESSTYKLLSAISKLRDIASLTRKRGIQMLSACSQLRITPTLVYINLFGGGYGVPVKKLFTIPGNGLTDTLSTLQQHRHIIKMYELEDQAWFMYLLDINSNAEEGTDEGWLAQTEWKNQQISLTYECLKSMMRNIENDWEQSVDGNVNIGQLILGGFFNSGDMSDIRTAEYFQNPYKMAMLSLIVDSTAWTNLLPLRLRPWETVNSVICPALCWFNRQLTNPHALRLMEDYDKSLSQKMKMTMKEIFKHCFLPTFTTIYFSELWVSMLPGTGADRSIKISVQPLSNVLRYKPVYFEEETLYSPPEDHYPDCIQRFHDELFGSVANSTSTSPYSKIAFSSWHPHLAAFLLNVLVKHQYCRANQRFLGRGHDNIVEDSFPYIIQCLPYAHTTQQNLDALRALSYLCPRVTPPWRPPAGFCSLTAEFLTKYEHSILSLEELHCLKKWLCDLEGLEARPAQSRTSMATTRNIEKDESAMGTKRSGGKIRNIFNNAKSKTNHRSTKNRSTLKK